MIRTAACFLSLVILAPACGADREPWQVLAPGEKSQDARLGKPRTLDDYFPMTVPASKEAWEKRRTAVREQLLVAHGLWPMPPKPPLNAVIHGKINRDEYTVEKVYFASLPGHYVTGNLYRPKKMSGKLPGVLCPHGHWNNGRFYDAGEAGGMAQIKQGAEKTIEGARYPLQARCAQLARMGCVVFHYDMVGYADSQGIAHRTGFTDAEADLRLQSFMGLQTWNSIRALDFLLSLPEIDSKRIGMTGASGGGTQTFTLCAIDDRPAVAFPAVMVSTAMQGGCICENCSGMRLGAGNIDFAALFAPKPLGMTGADDWTKEIETKGYPELKAVYRLYGAEDKVLAKCFPQFKHNYNQVSREVMYNWFNTHLNLGQKTPVTEKPFQPIPPKELSVFDREHPQPRDFASAPDVRKYLTATAEKQIAQLQPKDARGLAEYRRVMSTALRNLVHSELPSADEVEAKEMGDKTEADGVLWRRYLLGRKGKGEQVPAIGMMGKEFNGTVVVWIHPRGKASLFNNGKLIPEARSILESKAGILAIDAFQTGELRGPLMPVDKRYDGYTFGYNRPLLAQRVHDILTAVAFVRTHEKTKEVHLVGFEEAGPWVLLARGLCGDQVVRTAADLDGFRFEKVRETSDPMMLPGGLKYGGIMGLASLAAPGELWVHNHRGTGSGPWVKSVYAAAGATERLQLTPNRVGADKVIAWLLR